MTPKYDRDVRNTRVKQIYATSTVPYCFSHSYHDPLLVQQCLFERPRTFVLHFGSSVAMAATFRFYVAKKSGLFGWVFGFRGDAVDASGRKRHVVQRREPNNALLFRLWCLFLTTVTWKTIVFCLTTLWL